MLPVFDRGHHHALQGGEAGQLVRNQAARCPSHAGRCRVRITVSWMTIRPLRLPDIDGCDSAACVVGPLGGFAPIGHFGLRPHGSIEPDKSKHLAQPISLYKQKHCEIINPFVYAVDEHARSTQKSAWTYVTIANSGSMSRSAGTSK